MPRAAFADSTVVPEIPPIECVNLTLDEYGEGINYTMLNRASPDERRSFSSVFIARQMLADEIERLMAILDELDGEADLEFELAGGFGSHDPLQDGGEDDEADNEPTLASSAVDLDDSQESWAQGEYGQFCECETDPAETGIADLDGLAEQGAF